MSIRMRTVSLVAACSYLTIATVQSFAMEADESPEASIMAVPEIIGLADAELDDIKPIRSASESDESDSDDDDSYVPLSREIIDLGNEQILSSDPIEYALSVIHGRLDYNQKFIAMLRDPAISDDGKLMELARLDGHFSKKTKEEIPSLKIKYQVPGGDLASYIQSVIDTHTHILGNYNEVEYLIEKMRDAKSSERIGCLEKLYVLMLLKSKNQLLNRVKLCSVNSRGLGSVDINHDEIGIFSIISKILCLTNLTESRINDFNFFVKHCTEQEDGWGIDVSSSFRKTEDYFINIDSVFELIKFHKSSSKFKTIALQCQKKFLKINEKRSSILAAYNKKQLKSDHLAQLDQVRDLTQSIDACINNATNFRETCDGLSGISLEFKTLNDAFEEEIEKINAAERDREESRRAAKQREMDKKVIAAAKTKKRNDRKANGLSSAASVDLLDVSAATSTFLSRSVKTSSLHFRPEMNLLAASSEVSSVHHSADGLTHEDTSPQAARNLIPSGLKAVAVSTSQYHETVTTSRADDRAQKAERHRLAELKRAKKREQEREAFVKCTAVNSATAPVSELDEGLAPTFYRDKAEYPDWIWDLLHANHLKYNTIVEEFIHLSNASFQQFEGEMDLSAATASSEQRGHNIIFSLRSPIDEKLYSEGAHVLHGGALRKAWPSWRFAMIRLLQRASIIPAKR